MGKRGGGSSCLKIFGCVGDPPENDDSGSVQDKVSSTKKCKWRFRKRSHRRRVLSNNALLSEAPPPVTTVREKEEEEDNSDAPPPPAKIPVVKFAEQTFIIPPQPTSDDDDDDSHIEDSIVILIQTSIRRFLAQKEMVKLQSIVKLQAAVRGHLVRRQAIGTLRCVQAIVKIQALVRARRRCAENSVNDEGREKGIIISDSTSSQGKGREKGIIISDTKENIMRSSTEKLLANGFARQLLESLPSKRSKVIHISFDPSRSDSAWKWLERWMIVTSSDVTPQKELDPSTTEVQIPPVSYHSDEKRGAPECEDQIPPVSILTEKEERESEAPFKSPIVEFHDPPMSPISDEIARETSDSNSRQVCVAESDVTDMQAELLLNEKPHTVVVDLEKSRRTTKRMGESREEAESKRFGVGLRKSCNPAFAAVQSKFEELSAVPKSARRSFGDDRKSESDSSAKPNTPNLTDEQPQRDDDDDDDGFTKPEMNLTETVASRCGTEISVSSTLDSPDNLTEAGEMLFEIGALAGKDCETYASDDGNADSETPLQEPKIEETDIINPGNCISATSDHTVPADTPPKHEQETDQEEANRTPPEFSPMRSHMTNNTAQELLGTTPKSQISSHSNAEKSKKTAKRPRFQLAGSNSPANQNIETTPENLPKTGKRRNLTGARKLDHSGDLEPRMSSSSSSNSLPSYMQATESARAKVHASKSPKAAASPDVQQHDKESYAKKRHSLPFIDGKQASSSPRMQQSSEGNNTKSPQAPAAERKWRR